MSLNAVSVASVLLDISFHGLGLLPVLLFNTFSVLS